MNISLEVQLNKKVCEAYGKDDYTDKLVHLELCPEGQEGDVTVNCYKLAKELGTNPVELAEKICEWCKDCYVELNEDEPIDLTLSQKVVGGYVNIVLNPREVLYDTIGHDYTDVKCYDEELPERKSFLIEFSSPNTNKPMHLGHVRNNCIGDATARILKLAGQEVTKVNLVNDRGIHICKSMVAYKRWGEGKTPDDVGKKGDHFVGDFYVMFENEFKKQLPPEAKDLREDEQFDMTEIGREARETLRKWEEGDGETCKLWSTMNDWVMDGFADTYSRYGVSFDDTYMESDTYEIGKEIVKQGLKDGIFRKRDDGAVVVDLESGQEKVLLRKDGTSVYTTQDIGTTVLKHDDYHPDTQIWVVGDEQELHFKSLFEIMKKLGYDWADGLYHLSYGMVNLPDGRMKSREGTVVDADDILDRMELLASEETEGDESKVVALDALKFMMLKSNPKTTITFDPKEAIKFEGDTGAYLLYSYVRAQSIVRKVEERQEEDGKKNSFFREMLRRCHYVLENEHDMRLALRITMFGETIHKSARTLDCSVLSRYLLDLAKDFSTFYHACPILAKEDSICMEPRKVLVEAFAETMKRGMEALGMQVVEKM